MALNFETTNKIGVTTNYHRIKSISVTPIVKRLRTFDENDNFIEDVFEPCYLLRISLASYISEDYRREDETNSVFKHQYEFHVTLSEICQPDKNIFEIAYSRLKTLKEFVDSEDC